jgi:light-independent protochlorophyllide reductase subunit B
MGLEEHLLHMFREDFEFHADAAPSHLGRSGMPAAAAATAAAEPAASPAPVAPAEPAAHAEAAPATAANEPVWAPEAERELHKIPFFVRGKARRNTERYAAERGVATITVETLYDAKAHFAR